MILNPHRPRFENAINRRPKRGAWLALVALVVVATCAAAPRAQAAQTAPWTLTWSDEFDGAGLDPAKWAADEDCFGGGNHERQCYRAANVVVGGGELRLTARPEDASGPDGPWAPGALVTRHYTSGKVRTATRASFRYGRIEVRARLPRGQGLWPAIWLLPEHDNYGPYPQSGEIDLAEAVNLGAACPACAGGREGRVHASLHHGPNPQNNRQVRATTILQDPDAFHVFALEWTPQTMVWTVDGRPYFRQPTRPPFDQRFHLILNLAIGGRWAEGNGQGIDGRALPAVMTVDWVRVYEQLPPPGA